MFYDTRSPNNEAYYRTKGEHSIANWPMTDSVSLSAVPETSIEQQSNDHCNASPELASIQVDHTR
jgi:hypothetical protein